jgi:glycosyltransferase involved in cell wall biosynthesis
MLEWTMRSIRGQSYANVEHIIRDGASTDGTLAVLRDYERTYRMRWKSAPDAGMYHAINAGLREAKGEILAYLNSDDLYFPWTLQTVVDTFRRHPEADFVFGDVLAVDDQSGQQTFYWMPPFDLDFIRRSGFLAQAGVFWRRSAFEALGPFDESLRYVADCAYWMRAGERHHFRKVSEFLAIERNHGDTLRESTGGAVWTELDQVRARFVARSGWRNAVRLKRHALRRRLWHRAFLLALLLQLSLPARARGTSWRHFVDAAGGDINRRRLIARSIPFLGRRVKGEILTSSRRWLEPDGSA